MSATQNRLGPIATMVAHAACGCGWLLAGQGVVFAQDKMAAGTMFRLLDKSGDGVLTMDEATVGTRSILERVFKQAGKNSADRVTRDEFLTAHESLRTQLASGHVKTTPASPPEAAPARVGAEASTAGIGYVDTNGDGAVSRAEWSKFTQTFKSLDADKDGALTSTELQATGGLAALLSPITDANGDGKISRLEWAMLGQSFARLDANRDHSLDLAELQQVADAAVAAASGSASLSGDSLAGGSNLAGTGGKPEADSGPTLWRGHIEGHGEIELLVTGDFVVGREFVAGGDSESLGAGRIMMTGDGKSGNLDAVYTAGSHAGQVCLGIYLRDGDQLLWCVNNRGWRPLWFTGSGGDWLMTLTRVKAEPATEKAR